MASTLGWWRTLRGGGRPPRDGRLAALTGSKDDRRRLSVVRVEYVEQCRAIDRGDGIRDRLVNAVVMRFGSKVGLFERLANLAGRPFYTGIERSGTLGIRDIEVREFDGPLRRIRRLNGSAHSGQAAGKSAEEGGRKHAAKAAGSDHGVHGNLLLCQK